MSSSSTRQKLSTAYAQIQRIDELAEAESRRVDGLFKSSEVAVNAALVAQEKAVAAALAASEKAVKAEIAQANVNETQNEFRGTLRDQAQMLMPRTEAENVNRELRGLIGVQAEALAGLRSRLDLGPPSLASLQRRSDENVGRASSMTAGWDYLIRAALVAVAVIAAVIAIVKP